MGMLFGGWAKEEQEIVDRDFGGNWNLYREYKDKLKANEEINRLPIVYSDTFPKVCKGDVICVYDEQKRKATDTFFITEIKDGKPFGKYVDNTINNGECCFYPYEVYFVLCSATQL